MIEKYIGLPYCLHNRFGFNCWAFISLFYADNFGDTLQDFEIGSGSAFEIASTFAAAFANGAAGFHKVETPENNDLAVFHRGNHFHVGIWIDGKILHCSKHTAGVSYQDIKTAGRGFKGVQFWRK